MSTRLENIADPRALLVSIVDTLAQGLRLPYASVTAFRPDGEPLLAAESGTAGVRTIAIPLLHDRLTVGELQVAPRPGENDLSSPDFRALDELARPIAVAVRALALSEELQHARERLVTTREEERRRLRRDLHDGLGPALAALRLKLGTARTTLTSGNPAEAVQMLHALEADMARSVDAVRDLAYQLRPPVLDELGLIEALRATVADVPPPPQVAIRIHRPIPDLPAAVEVAAYRITGEALANVLRHADAHACEITLQADAELTVTIADDGRGRWPGPRPGVGLHAMHERAEELGGSLTVETPPGGGTRIIATLPLPRSQP